MKLFQKSQSKFPENFLFRPWSKTFELYHFQSPQEERRFKETSSSLAGKYGIPVTIVFGKNNEDNEFCTRVKNVRRFLSFALS